MTMPTTTDFELLHAIRLKGMAKNESIAALTGREESTLETGLTELADLGFATYREGRRVAGWVLTEAGRAEHAALLDEAAGDDEIAALSAPYEKFLTVNAQFKACCVRWMEAIDAGSDLADLHEELAGTHDTVAQILVDAEQAVPALKVHRQRLERARQEVADGNHAYVTSPLVDSYHTVWFEMHEDMILRQKIDRAAEGSF